MERSKIFDSLDMTRLNWHSMPIDQPPAVTLFQEIEKIERSIAFWKDVENNGSQELRDSSMQSILVSSFAFLMGHFETYQKAQIAALINSKDFYEFYDDMTISKGFEKLGCNITIQNIICETLDPREPGHIIVDCLPGWHDPEKVNQYFKPLLKNFDFYSSSDIDELKFLWQLRHSIVHSSGVVTRVDSIKSKRMRGFRDKKLSFHDDFIQEVTDCLYDILSSALDRLNIELAKLYICSEDELVDVDFIKILTAYPSRTK